MAKLLEHEVLELQTRIEGNGTAELPRLNDVGPDRAHGIPPRLVVATGAFQVGAAELVAYFLHKVRLRRPDAQAELPGPGEVLVDGTEDAPACEKPGRRIPADQIGHGAGSGIFVGDERGLSQSQPAPHALGPKV